MEPKKREFKEIMMAQAIHGVAANDTTLKELPKLLLRWGLPGSIVISDLLFELVKRKQF